MSDNLLSWDGAGFNIAMKELRHRRYYTPDVKELFSYEYHLVFIFNSLLSEYDNHSNFLKYSKYLGQAVTLEENFVMKRNGYDAVVFEDRKAKQKKGIVGELYACIPVDMLLLDSYHAHNVHNERSKILVSAREQIAPFKQGARRPCVEAWMYTGIPEAWENQQLAFATQRLEYGRPSWVYRKQEGLFG